MNINDFLMKYRQPFFAPDDGAGAGDAGAADAGSGDGGGDAGAGGAAGASDAAGAGETILGAAGADDADGSDADADAGEDAKNGDGSDDDADAAPAELSLEVPEGFEQFSDDFAAFSTAATDWMKENPEATVSDAFKWAAERQAELVQGQTQELTESFTAQVDGWDREAKADKDLGGDNFDANVAVAMTAIDTFGGPGLKAILNESGLGSHPEMIRFAVNAGKVLADSPVHKTSGGAAKKSLADALYKK